MTQGLGSVGTGEYDPYWMTDNNQWANVFHGEYNPRTGKREGGMFDDAPDWFKMDQFLDKLLMHFGGRVGNCDVNNKDVWKDVMMEMAEKAYTRQLPFGGRQLTKSREEIEAEVDKLLENDHWPAIRKELYQLKSRESDLYTFQIRGSALAQELAEGLTTAPWNPETDEDYQAYLAHLAELEKIFTDEPRLAIEQALMRYLAEHPDADIKDLNPTNYISHLAEVFGVELTTDQISRIKTEWEEFADAVDLTPSELADVISDYDADGPQGSKREFLLMIWHMLQGELEEDVAEENIFTSQKNKEIQEKQFNKYIEEQVEELNKSGLAKFFDGVKKWAGTIAACLGAVAACIVAGVAAVSGIGTAAGIALAVAAIALTVMAVNMVVQQATDGEVDMFGEVGKHIIAPILEAFGADVDEEEVAMWTSVAINMALAITAAACSFGAASALSGISGAAGTISSISNMVSAGCSITNGVVAGASAGVNLDLALHQADLLEIRALLEQLSEARNIEQELMAKILSKIFEAMRGDLATAMDTTLENIESIVAMNLNKA